MEKNNAAAPAAGQAGLATDIVREAVEAAFEERVGWRAKIAAAVRALATPADAGAGEVLTIQRIAELIDEHTDRDFGLIVEPFAHAIEREVLARMSTSGAPVPTEIAKALGLWEPVSMICAVKAIEALRSPAPVTAEPAQSIDTPEFRELMVNFGYWVDEEEAEHDQSAADLIAYINKRLAPAPAKQAFSLQTRDAIRNEALEEAARACDQIARGWNSAMMSRKDFALSVRALKSMERAADAAETRDASGRAQRTNNNKGD